MKDMGWTLWTHYTYEQYEMYEMYYMKVYEIYEMYMKSTKYTTCDCDEVEKLDMYLVDTSSCRYKFLLLTIDYFRTLQLKGK